MSLKNSEVEESFIVSARKYRPESWETVVGQEAITSTLDNAIKNKQLATGYLFCGPRGVGKTSCARIFAREVNREFTDENDDFAYNIFELDAASNNKVEHIRSLIEQVRIPPQRGKYKVYIIDEVHMLTTQAFNAFLKTLEEPPAHAIFILATTEKHKIIPTILSRCQIFDFRRIGVDDIARHLGNIAEKENITAEAEALHVIAQKADGALRDALSIFDQLASFTGRNLSYDAVIENLNVLDHQYYFKVVDFILQEDIKSSLLLLDQVVSKGFDTHHFVEGLGEHFRNLMMAKNPETVYLMELAEQVKDKMVEQSENCDIQFIIQALEFINHCDQNYRLSMNQRMTVELLLMQLGSIPHNLREKKNFKFELIPAGGMQLKEEKATTESSETPVLPAQLQRPEAPRLAKPSGFKSGKSYKVEESISLADLLSETEVSLESDDDSAADGLPEEEFSREQFIEAYSDVAQSIKESHGEILFHTLMAEIPDVTNGTEIQLKLHSSASSLAIDTIRQELVDKLRQRLRNKNITLNSFLDKTEDSNAPAAMLTGDKEKYELMKSKNAALENLRIALKLDFED